MIDNRLQLTDLEKEFLKYFLARNNIDQAYFGEDFHLLAVTSRNMTGTGFVTDIQTDKSLKETGVRSSRWSKIGAWLNNNIKVRFLVYVDDYILDCIEGYTYGDTAWPEEITSFMMRELGDNEF